MKPKSSSTNSLSKAELSSGPRYWRSLDDLAQSPEYKERIEREFGPGASDLNEVDSRHFFKIMGASFALGGIGLAGCRRPESHILPHSKSPENLIPGQPLYYASSYSLRGESIPLLVETHTGRPTKIEGNDLYESCGGGTTLKAQASILDLYDPDRSTKSSKSGVSISNADVEDLFVGLAKELGSTKGEGFAILAESSSSPTRLRLKKEIRKAYPKLLWSEYDSVSERGAKVAAAKVLGEGLEAKYDFSKAERVLSVDGDFLGQDNGSLKFNRQFAAGRRLRKSTDSMNRLYTIESNFTTTGAMADHRLRLASSRAIAALAALAIKVGVSNGSLATLAAALEDNAKSWIDHCGDDLIAHGGKCLVYVGQQLSAEAHALGLAINEQLGNLGKSVNIVDSKAEIPSRISDLASSIASGSVKTLLVAGGNPVYNAPAGLDFDSLIEKVDTVVRLGYNFDETSAKSTYHIVEAHYLETWGDGRSYDGHALAQQPMILPLFGGLSFIEILGRLLGVTNNDGHSLVLETFAAAFGGLGKRAFDKFLHEGFVSGSGYKSSDAGLSASALSALLSKVALPSEASDENNLEVVFVNDATVDDGRYLNNGWLQECPDPMTKLTWDNAIIVSPRLAAKLDIVASDSMIQVARKNPNKVRDGRQFAPMATVSVGGREVTGAIHIQPGLDNWTIVLPLGYGREMTGRVGTDSGFNASAIRDSESSFANGASLALIPDQTYQLASTQEHWSMEGRAIIREANLDTYKSTPDWADHMGMESHSPAVYGKDAGMATEQKITTTPRGGSMYEHPDLTGVHQWGMNIDLNVCTGCNACVVACQSENNIPIVGRDQVRRGREMHWIRLDRYFASNVTKEEDGEESLDYSAIPEDPQVALQPIACMHCETAPCETVCPVNATVHDEEGLNTMAYNRCVGTRYCANNCPYKVRRFNFFDYQQRNIDELYLGPLGEKGMPELTQMAQNPDVSVRMRGVMEKCTFCVQRITQAKITQKAKAKDSSDVKIPEGTFKVACQQVCSTDAIVFGDLSDTESEVAQLRENERNYSVLGYLNTRPRTTFLAKVRNPNPEMPDYHAQPLSKLEYDEASGGSHGGGHEDSHGDAHHEAEAAHSAPDDNGGHH